PYPPPFRSSPPLTPLLSNRPFRPLLGRGRSRRRGAEGGSEFAVRGVAMRLVPIANGAIRRALFPLHLLQHPPQTLDLVQQRQDCAVLQFDHVPFARGACLRNAPQLPQPIRCHLTHALRPPLGVGTLSAFLAIFSATAASRSMPRCSAVDAAA